MTKYAIPSVDPRGLLKEDSVYKHQNDGFYLSYLFLYILVGKFYMSFDLKSANFTALRWLVKFPFIIELSRCDPNVLMGANTWTEFLSHFIEDPYFDHSKSFRQKIFWHLESRKLNDICKFLVYQIYNSILSSIEKSELNWKPEQAIMNTDEVYKS